MACCVVPSQPVMGKRDGMLYESVTACCAIACCVLDKDVLCGSVTACCAIACCVLDKDVLCGSVTVCCAIACCALG